MYEHYSGRFLGICMRYIKARPEAEEVMINGWMKIYNAVVNFESKGSFEGWMKRIMVNESLMYLRSKGPLHLSIDTDHEEVKADNQADQNINAEDLLKLMDDLPPGYRAVFNLYAIEGYGHKEIGEMLGISEGASKSQLSKARATLQKKLAGLEAYAA